MTIECIKHVTETLERELGQQFNRDKMNALWPKFKEESDKAMCAAYDYIITHGKHFPTEEKLLQCVQVEGRKIAKDAAIKREEAWNEEKRQDRKHTIHNILNKEQQTEYAKRAVQIWHMVTPCDDMGRPLPRSKERLSAAIELCDVMAKTYPHTAGEWTSLAASLTKG
jgi:hypothetical protein